MPARWKCQLRKKAYLCRYGISKSCKKNPKTEGCKKQIKRSREAVVVISAKPKSEIDSMSAFQNFFGAAKKMKIAGNDTQSKVVHNKSVAIKKQKWVDTMHLGSELPHYYTRYLATIHNNVAVLVTFTAHKKYYTDYSAQFFKGIKSLQVTATDLNNVNKNELGDRLLSRPVDIPDDIFDTTADRGAPADPLSSILFGLSLIFAAAGVYVWIKKRKSS